MVTIEQSMFHCKGTSAVRWPTEHATRSRPPQPDSCASACSPQPGSGLIIIKTATLLVLATYTEHTPAAAAIPDAHVLTDQLISMGC